MRMCNNMRLLVQEYVPGVGSQQRNMIVDQEKKKMRVSKYIIDAKHFTLRRKEIPFSNVAAIFSFNV